jgi:hypothetical protein
MPYVPPPEPSGILVLIPTTPTPPARTPAGIDPGTSPWWICRLLDAMDARKARLNRLRQYHRGEQDTWKLHSEAARLAFNRTFSGLKANLAAAVVAAPARRLKVEGFRVPVDGPTDVGATTVSDTEAWRIWQANAMDGRSAIAHTEAIAMGECPVIIDRDPDDARTPRITVEDPLQVVVERDPADPRRRLAALKCWVDPDGTRVVILYLPDRLEWWRSVPASSAAGRRAAGFARVAEDEFDLRGTRWRFDPDRSGASPTPDAVPVVLLVNQPRVDGTGQGEHESIIPLLDAINKTLIDLLTTSEFTAAPQRWATGINLDQEENETDADGNVTRVAPTPITQAANHWITTDTPSPDASFGQFPVAQLEPYTKAIDEFVELITAGTSTPFHLLLAGSRSVPMTGEARKTAEHPLDQKVEGMQVDFGEAWEEVMRLAFLAIGDVRHASTRSEVRWRPQGSSSESQHTDALVKLAGIGVDFETLLELYPFSPEQIARIKARIAATADAAPPAPIVQILRDASGQVTGVG